MKYILSLFAFVSIFFSSSAFADDALLLEYFGRDDCGHCQAQKGFLETLDEEVEVVYYNIETEEGKDLFDQVAEKSGLSKTTPLTWVANTFVQGFQSDATTGKRLEDLLAQSRLMDAVSVQEYLERDDIIPGSEVGGGVCDDEKCTMTISSEFLFEIPFIGVVDVEQWSLGIMSLVLGLVDGFNPCAMWVLIMFLLALSQAGSLRRMFEMAGIFILAEAIMYYLILNVWMTTWDFIGLDRIITPIVGLIAIGGGIFFLYEAITSDGTCKVTSFSQQKKMSQKVQELAQSPMTWAVFIGIIVLAFSVNIIEFACSIGIPQAFTKILDINMLTWLEQQWYMFLYIVAYMFDDIIVFGLALVAFEKIYQLHGYTRWVNAIGGILMLAIGALMILYPELLVL